MGSDERESFSGNAFAIWLFVGGVACAWLASQFVDPEYETGKFAFLALLFWGVGAAIVGKAKW